MLKVLSGGKFDIDYEVMSPTGEIINSGRKRKFGEFVFQNRGTGDYSFCFENGMSTFAEKKVEFEIIVCLKTRNYDIDIDILTNVVIIIVTKRSRLLDAYQRQSSTRRT